MNQYIRLLVVGLLMFITTNVLAYATCSVANCNCCVTTGGGCNSTDVQSQCVTTSNTQYYCRVYCQELGNDCTTTVCPS